MNVILNVRLNKLIDKYTYESAVTVVMLSGMEITDHHQLIMAHVTGGATSRFM